jgi:hypothetical protein
VNENLFHALAAELVGSGVRFVVIGVWGVNLHAVGGSVTFRTDDRDLFLPPDPANLLAAWRACEALGFELTSGREPLDTPRDEWLAQQIVSQRALTRATDGAGLQIDLTLVMGGFEFDAVWRERR